MTLKPIYHRYRSINQYLRFCIEAVLVTAAAYGLTNCIMPELLELSSVFTVKGQEEYQISDFYNRIATTGGRIRKDGGQVVCLNYEGSSRADVAELLNALVDVEDSASRPKVVALDFYFPAVKPNDDVLIRALENCASKTRLVMPYIVKYNEDSTFTSDNSSYMNEMLAKNPDLNVSFGVINLAGNYFTDVMRDFRYGFVLTDSAARVALRNNSHNCDSVMLSMPAEMAWQKMLADGVVQCPRAVSDSCSGRVCHKMKALFKNSVHTNERNPNHVIINYKTDTVFVYGTNYLVDKALVDTCEQCRDKLEEIRDVIKGRAVIIGSLEDVKDTYITPLADLQAGVLVHAYGADTILTGNYVSQTARWVEILVAVLLCLVLIFFDSWATECADIAVNSIVRVTQFLLMLILVWVGYLFFVYGDRYIDFNVAVVMLVSGVLTYDLYSGIVFLLKKFYSIFDRLYNSVARKCVARKSVIRKRHR